MHCSQDALETKSSVGSPGIWNGVTLQEGRAGEAHQWGVVLNLVLLNCTGQVLVKIRTLAFCVLYSLLKSRNHLLL